MQYINGDIYDGDWSKEMREGKGNNNIIMVIYMMVIGVIIKEKVKGYKYMPTVTSTRAIGIMI